MKPLLTVVTIALLAAGPAWAAAPAPARPAPAKPAPGQPAKGDAPGDPDLVGAGKVIEIDPEGNAKVVKGEPAKEESAPPAATEVKPAEEKLKPGEISKVEACKLRFNAQCAVVKRCMKDAPPELTMSCESLAAACESGLLTGKAPYARKAVEACAKGIAALKCDVKVDPLNPESMQVEGRVPACKPLLDLEKAELAKQAKEQGAPTDEGMPKGFKEIDLGGAGKTIDVGDGVGKELSGDGTP